MLQAVLRGKAGRVVQDGEATSWKELFRQREDLLTAAFFGRLTYLSGSCCRALVGSLFSMDVGESPLRAIDFWPRLDADTLGRSHVEPDVLIFFDKVAVMVEVKPPLGAMQSREQWAAEIAAFSQAKRAGEIPEGIESLHFVALGRNSAKWQTWCDSLVHASQDLPLRIACLEWQQVSDQVHSVLNDAQGTDASVLEDISQALSLFGIHSRQPQGDISKLGRLHPSDLHAFGRGGMQTVEVLPALGSRLLALVEFSHRNQISMRSGKHGAGES